MKIKNLSLINFKNCPEADLQFTTKFICFTGLNGAGKTNILDALHYLSFCKSYFLTTDNQNIRNENNFFVIQAEFERKGIVENIFCGIKQGKKKIFKRNDSQYAKLSEHIGLLPIVFISPSDSVLITGGGEDRRKFIDSVISQYDRKYLQTLIVYNRILAQRNKLLKDFAKNNEFNVDFISILSEQLAEKGDYIHSVRKTFIAQFQPVFSEYYKTISSGKETPILEYKSQFNEKNMLAILNERIEKDRVLQYTSAGTHRDDLTFNLGNSPIKKTGSQGQQKTFLIALKLAQFKFLKDFNGFSPLLLLDDIFDKFDSLRAQQIINLATEKDTFGQVFITDTNKERLKNVLSAVEADYQIFHLADGIPEMI